MTTLLALPTVHEALAAARSCAPGFTPAGAPVATDTSLLIPGTVRDGDAFVKVPTDRRPFWLSRARHEIAVYRALHGRRAPVPMPGLLGARTEAPALVISRLPGHPLALERYPHTPLPHAGLDALLSALDAVHHWRPSGTAWADDSDYPRQLALLALLTDGQLAAAGRVFARARRHLPLRLEFGDGHPGNALLPPGGGPLALVDWEFLAHRLPGYDHAVLWVLLGDHPVNRRPLTTALPEALPHQAAFWLAAALVAGRELVSHQRWAPTPARRRRIPRLRADLTHALDQLTVLDPKGHTR